MTSGDNEELVCYLPGCSNTFIRTAHNKKYCSEKCTNFAYRTKNKDRISKQWRDNYALVGYETHIKRKYGLSLTEWKALSENGCEICGTKTLRLVVDHDHITGKVRGCLCVAHNAGLGSFHDSVEELKQAIKYLEEHA